MRVVCLIKKEKKQMRNSMYIGEGPYNEEENMPRMDSDTYESDIRVWLNRWIEQIRSVYGEEPSPSRLKIKANPHDFGVYYSVEYYYDDSYEVQEDYAFAVEGDVKDGISSWA